MTKDDILKYHGPHRLSTQNAQNKILNNGSRKQKQKWFTKNVIRRNVKGTSVSLLFQQAAFDNAFQRRNIRVSYEHS